MGLFGVLRVMGESISASVKEWAGTDYLVKGLTAVVGGASAAFLGEFVPTVLNVPAKWYNVAKGVFKFVYSGLLYYLGVYAKAPEAGLFASIGAFTSLGTDIVQWMFKTTPEEAGKETAMSLMAGAWRAAATSVGSPTPMGGVEETSTVPAM